MIGNHKDTNKYPINLLIINYLYNFFHRPYNSFLSIFKQLLKIVLRIIRYFVLNLVGFAIFHVAASLSLYVFPLPAVVSIVLDVRVLFCRKNQIVPLFWNLVTRLHFIRLSAFSVFDIFDIIKAWKLFLAWPSGFHAHLSNKLFHAVQTASDNLSLIGCPQNRTMWKMKVKDSHKRYLLCLFIFDLLLCAISFLHYYSVYRCKNR